jgi:hypothetical protein
MRNEMKMTESDRVSYWENALMQTQQSDENLEEMECGNYEFFYENFMWDA